VKITKEDILILEKFCRIWDEILWCKNYDEILGLLPDHLHHERQEIDLVIEKLKAMLNEKPNSNRLTIAQEVEKVAVKLQELRRMEDAGDDGWGECISCGASVHYTMGDGGHYKSRGKTSTKLDERNINLQCKRCNGWPDGETGSNYGAALDRKYGAGTKADIESLSRFSRKYTRDELAVLLADINKRIKEQEERLS